MWRGALRAAPWALGVLLALGGASSQGTGPGDGIPAEDVPDIADQHQADETPPTLPRPTPRTPVR